MKTIRQLFGAAAGVVMMFFGGFAHAEYSGSIFVKRNIDPMVMKTYPRFTSRVFSMIPT